MTENLRHGRCAPTRSTSRTPRPKRALRKADRRKNRLLASVPSRPQNGRTTLRVIPRPSTCGACTTAQTTICGLPSMALVGVHPLRRPKTTRPPMVTPGDRREPGGGPPSNHRASLTLLAHRRSWVTPPAFPGLPELRSPQATIPSMTLGGRRALGPKRKPSVCGVAPLPHRGSASPHCAGLVGRDIEVVLTAGAMRGGGRQRRE